MELNSETWVDYTDCQTAPPTLPEGEGLVRVTRHMDFPDTEIAMALGGIVDTDFLFHVHEGVSVDMPSACWTRANEALGGTLRVYSALGVLLLMQGGEGLSVENMRTEAIDRMDPALEAQLTGWSRARLFALALRGHRDWLDVLAAADDAPRPPRELPSLDMNLDDVADTLTRMARFCPRALDGRMVTAQDFDTIVTFACDALEAEGGKVGKRKARKRV